MTATYPFLVGFSTQVFSPPKLGNESPSLFPVEAASTPILTGPLVEGRLPDPDRADEIVVDENTRDRFGLDLGSTLVLGQELQPGEDIPPQFQPVDGATNFRERMRVVGIAKSVSSELSWTPSSGFYAKYGSHMPSLVNEFVNLRDGRAGIAAFNREVNRILGHPVNVEDTYDLYGIRKALNVTDRRARRSPAVRARRAPRRWRARGAGARACSLRECCRPAHLAGDGSRPATRAPCARDPRVPERDGRRGHDRRRRDRPVLALPTGHRARLRPRSRHARRLAGARRRRRDGARRGAGDRGRGGLVAGDPDRARDRLTRRTSIASSRR